MGKIVPVNIAVQNHFQSCMSGQNQFYPNPNYPDKSFDTAYDVVQPELLAECCAPLKVPIY
jgi:hypothetical protein